MDSGLIQVLVIAFFVIISMMDGVARKKRQEQQRQAAPQVERPDEESDFGGTLFSTTSETTSEGMVPSELWEEIAALARGEAPPSARRLPPTTEADDGPASDMLEAPELEESWLDPAHQHVESHDHVEWAPDDRPTEAVDHPVVVPAPRLPDSSPTHVPVEHAEVAMVARVDKPEGSVHESPDGATVRQTLMEGGISSLRQAVILSEVLGPPAALRDIHHEPPGSGR